MTEQEGERGGGGGGGGGGERITYLVSKNGH